MKRISGWRVGFDTTAEGAACLEDAFDTVFSLDEAPPTISSFEVEEHISWRIDLFFAKKPEMELVRRAVAQVREICAASLPEPVLEPIEEKNWVSESQKLLVPVEARRFFIYGAHDKQKRRPFGVNLQVDAGEAFGTGQHATTEGCLLMLDRLARLLRPRNVLDLGCGSAILALAMAKHWRRAVFASDIDPVAVRVARYNAVINKVPRLNRAGDGYGLSTLCAVGMKHRRIAQAAPFDLIVANILAAPLKMMAQEISLALLPGGYLVLAGLLAKQEAALLATYRARGLVLVARHQIGDWPTLLLRKGKAV